MTLLEELKLRDCFFDTTAKDLEDVLENKKCSFYLGCDPTGPSLHVGHLFGFIIAKRLANYGFTPVILVGGATGLIGDPKMQGERSMLSLDVVKENVISLKNQIKKIFKFNTIVNNYDWISKINVIEFLRDYGKLFSVSTMINKETVKQRLDKGISYTEFSYQILQSLDWLHLYKNMNVKMQIGGQDQWGNITSGCDLIRKTLGQTDDVYSYTFPLITKSDGTKFGKSEGGKSIWLDKNRTSVYDFYQFFINTSDDEVIKRLKQFTFLSLEEIEKIKKIWEENKEQRYAQKVLAKEITTFVHGKIECNKAIKLTDKLFNQKISSLTKDELLIVFNDLEQTDGTNLTLVDIVCNSNLASSKREAREFITSGAIYINDIKYTDINYVLSNDFKDTILVIRRGKKKYALVVLK